MRLNFLSFILTGKPYVVSAASAKSYTGKFAEEGVFFLSPQLTDKEIEKLRKGERLEDRRVQVKITGLTVDGVSGKDYIIEINLKDFTETQGRVFFGDRPLSDPGYTKFELSGNVSKATAATVDSAQEALDIWRVEQRLNYLAFPALGAKDDKNRTPSLDNNVIQDFKVDGVWNQRESLAALLFSDVVTYANGQRQLATPNGIRTSTPVASKVQDTAANRTAYFNTLYATADSFTITTNGGFENNVWVGDPGVFTDWLNAYNAPHWMNIGTQMGKGDLSGWKNNQTNTNEDSSGALTNGDVETYGTSWMRDLMAAVQFAPTELASGKHFGFNGGVDANHGATPFMHGTHDLGMAFDLELKQFINARNQNDASQKNANITLPDSGWSVSNAAQWTEKYLPHDLGPNSAAINDQRDALRQFLQLYALSADSGTRAALATHLVNGTDKSVMLEALFGNGTPTGGMVSQVHIGSLKKDGTVVTDQNPYANINKILDQLGINASPVQDHHNHFHIFLAPPAPVNITASLLAETAADTPQTMGAADILTAAQTLLAQIQPDNQEETLMFIMDVPNIPAQEPPLIVADASASQSTTQQFDRTIGVCHLSDGSSSDGAMEPHMEINDYYRKKEHFAIKGAASVSILQMPAHGALDGPVNGAFAYLPEKGYIGNDRASLLVEVGGKKVRMEYFFRVMKSVPDTEGIDPYKDLCPNKVRVWKISSITDTNGNNYITAVAYQSPTASANAKSMGSDSIDI